MKGRRNWIIEFFRLGDAGTGRHGREMLERTEMPMESELGRRNEAQQTVQRWERLEHGEKRRMDHRKGVRYKPDRATMRPDCVSACIEQICDIDGDKDGQTDKATE